MPEHRNQSGMTLVEILVAMAILGVIITGIYNLFRVHNLMAARQEETTLMQQEILSALVQMADDLRMCGYTPDPDIGPFGFNATQTNATAVYCTKNATGAGNDTEIGYRFDAANNEIDIFLTSNATWEATSSNIAALNLVYLNNNGTILNPVTDAANIRYVDITATATASAERSNLNIGNRTMSTRVYCRNTGI